MLFITRRGGQSVYIGDEIKIKVNQFGIGKVLLTVETTGDMPLSGKVTKAQSVIVDRDTKEREFFVVARYRDQLRFGNDVEVLVCDLTSEKLGLAIDAPREVPIFREELLSKTLPV